jgi:hypothetical protein
LLFEALAQHLVRFIQNQELHVPSGELVPPNHIEDTSGCSGYDVDAIFQLSDVFSYRFSTHTSMHLRDIVNTSSIEILLYDDKGHSHQRKAKKIYMLLFLSELGERKIPEYSSIDRGP